MHVDNMSSHSPFSNNGSSRKVLFERALDLRTRGIRVNVIGPGAIATPGSSCSSTVGKHMSEREIRHERT